MKRRAWADLIEGVAGEFAPFEELHGFSIDGVDLETAVLPDGGRDRLVKVQNANTAAPSGEPRLTGWCLDKEASDRRWQRLRRGARDGCWSFSS